MHDLRVHPIGSHSIFLTWQPPLQPNGNVRGYFVHFESIVFIGGQISLCNSDSTNGFVEETYVLHRQLFYLHEMLKPDFPYRVSVWAETLGGEGARVTRTVRTWPDKGNLIFNFCLNNKFSNIFDPDPPIFSLRQLSAKVLLVEWHPINGSRWRMPGTTFQVNYRPFSE